MAWLNYYTRTPSSRGANNQQGLGLFSFLLGEREFTQQDIDPESKISNLSKLKDLFVFDQWIFNDDRAMRHIIVGTEPSSPASTVLYAYDHGHTLNGYKGQKWTTASLTDEQTKAIGQVYFDSGIKGYTELEDIIAKTKGVSDGQVDSAINNSIDAISHFKVTADELERVTANAEVVRKLLKRRRDFIDEIIRAWCQRAGKRPSYESSGPF